MALGVRVFSRIHPIKTNAVYALSIAFSKILCYTILKQVQKSIDLRKVEKGLRQIKGIGDKRVEEIMAVFEKHLGV